MTERDYDDHYANPLGGQEYMSEPNPYESPKAEPREPAPSVAAGSRAKGAAIAPAYDRQIWFSVKQQVVLAVLATLVLDMGQTARGMAAIMIGYWCGVVVIVLRRPASPSKGDLFFVRWGCSLIAASVAMVFLASTFVLD